MAKRKAERMKIDMPFEDALKAILAAPPLPKKSRKRVTDRPKKKVKP